jgi:hypothetical protein
MERGWNMYSSGWAPDWPAGYEMLLTQMPVCSRQ